MSPVESHPSAYKAHVLPFFLFIGFLAVVQFVGMLGEGTGVPWLADPKYWIYPLQTAICAGALVYFWKCYDFGKVSWLVTVVAALLSLGIWISPQWLFGAAPRTDGFNPSEVGDDPWLVGFTLIARFARLVIVVPLVEEIFWRGFLQRYLVNEKFTSVKFGTYTHLSFFGVAGAFMLVHSPSDWPAAIATGVLFGWVAVKTKSLLACVIAHAMTNLGLGIYIVMTKQWGFW